MQFKKLIPCLGLVVCLLSGCAPSQAAVPDTAAAPVPPRATATSPALMALPTSTRTGTARRQTPSTPISPPQNTATPTHTPVPTFEPVTARLRLQRLIQSPGDCRLPCWWGITPGKSTMEDFDTLIAPYSSLVTFYGDGSGFSFGLGQEITSNFYIDYLHYADRDIVEAIYVSTQALREIKDSYEIMYEPMCGAESYRRLVKKYLLPQVLTAYGQPSKVLIFGYPYTYDGRPPGPGDLFGSLTMRLFYPEQGIIAMYKMPLTPIGEMGQGCPSEAFVEFWLTPPDPDGDYERLVSAWEGWKKPFERDKPLDEALSMNLEEFYETFRTSDQTCVQTPLSIWPSEW